MELGRQEAVPRSVTVTGASLPKRGGFRSVSHDYIASPCSLFLVCSARFKMNAASFTTALYKDLQSRLCQGRNQHDFSECSLVD